jgi:hypothetical protein
MNKANGNYIKFSIYKVKICSETPLNAFNLKMDFCKQTYETDKISSKEADLGGKVIFL